MKPKKILIPAAAAIVAVGAWIFFLLRQEAPSADADSNEFLSDFLPGGTGNTDMQTGEGSAFDDPAETLADYKKWAQYPPTTRPLHAGQVDLLRPFDLPRPPTPVLQFQKGDCTGTGTDIQCAKPPTPTGVACALTPERSFSVGTGDFKVTLSCTPTESEARRPLAIENLRAIIHRNEGGKQVKSLPPIAFGDNGRDGDAIAGDHVYTFVVRPAAKDWGFLFLQVAFKVNGMDHGQSAGWFSTPHRVAAFKQGVTDREENGHLVVSVPITVYKTGHYSLAANLVDAEDDRPVASASWNGDLAAGDQVVPMQFFGKVIHDSRIDGPYRITHLRGQRENSAVSPGDLKRMLDAGGKIEGRTSSEPQYEFFEPYPNEYTTANYRAHDFSSEEWQSETKSARLEYLEGLVRGQ